MDEITVEDIGKAVKAMTESKIGKPDWLQYVDGLTGNRMTYIRGSGGYRVYTNGILTQSTDPDFKVK